MVERKDLTIEQLCLLEEARRRYPIGTVFISARYPNKKSTYNIHTPYWEFYNHNEISVNYNTGASIYKDGIWGEIVSLPKDHIPESIVINTYSIW